MAFFKKAEDINNRIFLQDRKSDATPPNALDEVVQDVGWSDETGIGDERFNEIGGSIKRRKTRENVCVSTSACSPPPPIDSEAASLESLATKTSKQTPQPNKKVGPFVDDSDSEEDGLETPDTPPGTIDQDLNEKSPVPEPLKQPVFQDNINLTADNANSDSRMDIEAQFGEDGLDEYEGSYDDEMLEGEEYDERKWMHEQWKLELEEGGYGDDLSDFDPPSMFPDDKRDATRTKSPSLSESPSCPLCNTSLPGLTEDEVSIHVNACLDGKGNSSSASTIRINSGSATTTTSYAKAFKNNGKLAKPGQASPFQFGATNSGPTSAFSKLMAGHAEDAAWASAAAENNAARGKPAYKRTCPFYKIMPGFFIAVDAFRYGAVQGQKAYFLSHFHSDHYIGLTSSWSHGPIYCSRVTANLVRQQLRVDPKWVVDLEFEQKTEVPETQGVFVTMISANHCPGSSLFLFEKEVGKGHASKLQRVLHCGDFRACQAHVEHPLLQSNILDAVSGEHRQQKLDVCYLDTTYLNPKYAFPPQQQVIQACADMCVSLSKAQADESDGWEQMRRQRAGLGMVKFVHKSSHIEGNETLKSPYRGRLLVVVGTYSIGKERICVGIAKALASKIYAPANKQRICRALEDPELQAMLTSDPRDAQVHMTPLFEIRADTLDDYLRDYADAFSRCVGFRPSGWNYRPPNSRFTESPAVQTVLHSQNWKSNFSMKDLVPQRGSTSRASCFGVPYSEHSSFRELTMFCCALKIDKIIPTVNIGSAKSRDKMKAWCERWAVDKKKNGLFKPSADCW